MSSMSSLLFCNQRVETYIQVGLPLQYMNFHICSILVFLVELCFPIFIWDRSSTRWNSDFSKNVKHSRWILFLYDSKDMCIGCVSNVKKSKKYSAIDKILEFVRLLVTKCFWFCISLNIEGWWVCQWQN